MIYSTLIYQEKGGKLLKRREKYQRRELIIHVFYMKVLYMFLVGMMVSLDMKIYINAILSLRNINGEELLAKGHFL